MKKILLLLTLVSLFSFNSNATHGVGGDIRFVQTGPNSYTVYARLFRFLSGANLTGPQTFDIRDQVTCAFGSSVTVTEVNRFVIPFGDECYTPPTGSEVEQIEYTGTIANLPNNPNGYKVMWDLCCRPTLTNMGAGNVGLYTHIPDPALAQGNSTPRFVDYPTDGYFCVNNLKCINFAAVDPDGDSLSYELVNPIEDWTNCVPNYLAFSPGYNMQNILGPGSSCTIDAVTGCVWARPAQLGTYTISVKCTEWRNGVRIGELIRDLQYYALNCSYNTLPSFENFPTVQVLSFDDEGCFDIVASDRDAQDTFFISILSNAYDFGATISLPTPNAAGNYDFEWEDATMPSGVDTANNVNVTQITATEFMGDGTVGARFCWNLDNCDILTVDSFYVEALGYSIGCDASKDTVRSRVSIPIQRATYSYNVPNVFSPNGDGVNDLFYLKKDAYDRCYDALNIRVYNRWGQLVYESEDAKFEWDGNDESGNPLSAGSYFVILQGYYGGEEVTQNFPLTLFR